MSLRPVIVQHVVGVDGGGPLTQLNLLLKTWLAEKYRFEVVSQTRPTGGLNLRLLWELAAAIRMARPELVHVRGLLSGGFHGLMAARMAGCRRILVSVHGTMLDVQREGAFLRLRAVMALRLFEPLTLRLATAVYCVCRFAAERAFIKRHARRLLGVVPNGIAIKPMPSRDESLRSQLGYKSDDMVGLYVGRMVRDKGLLVLAEALHKLEQAGRNQPRLLLVGDGPDEGAVRRAFGSLTASGRVRFLGHRSDIPALQSVSDFFVFPTFHENLSNALLEAMHAGRAVLATRVGGNPEVVLDGVTGQLVAPGDPGALVAGLRRFAENRAIVREMGNAGRRRVEQCFSMERVASDLDHIYSGLLAEM
jgi:glycosyltransferase involved in cell wall biosynthesis